MNNSQITHYTDEHHRITALIETEVPEPVHQGWTNFVSKCSVRAIAVAPRSCRLWLATWGGVISWNPKEELFYRRYSSEHGLAGNAVSCICLDQTEHPWAGHVEGGLSYFDGQRWQVYEHLQSEPIRAVCLDVSSGGIWAAGIDTVYRIPGLDRPPKPVAARRQLAVTEALALLDVGDKLLLGNAWGLFCLGINKEPVQLVKETIQTCTALIQDRDGNAWLGTAEEVYCLEGEKLIGPIAPSGPETAGRVLGLATSQGCIWVLTTVGLAQIVDNCWLPVSPLPEQCPGLHAIAADTDGTSLWVGTDRLLAYVQLQKQAAPIWNMNCLPLHQDDELNNLGRCVAQQASNGRVWIGTAEGLIAFGPDDKWTLEDSGNVRALGVGRAGSAKSKTLWMLVWPRGIRQWVKPNWIDFHSTQPAGLTMMLTIGQDGYPYVLAGHALWRLSSNGMIEVVRSLPFASRCLAQTPDGTWWLGAPRGVYHLNSGEWELAGEQPGPLQAGVRALAVIRDCLWAATEMGLWMRRGENWEPYDVEPDDKLCDVQAIAPAGSDGGLWLARESKVVRYDPTTRQQSMQYTTANSGLGSRRVTALAEIDGVLWAVTQAGISRLRLV